MGGGHAIGESYVLTIYYVMRTLRLSPMSSRQAIKKNCWPLSGSLGFVYHIRLYNILFMQI